MNKIVLIALTLLLSLGIGAQTIKVRGEYTYYSDPNMSPKEAMAAAIEYARVQALAKEFGMLISQYVIDYENKDDAVFKQMNASEVKGEWLEDTEKPEARIVDTTPEGMLVVSARVEGRARPLTNEAAMFDALVLRNGTELRMAETEFKAGDRLYLYFKAPADGYVAAYLIDESQTVSCLLPHEDDEDGQQPVTHGREYVFFSERYDAGFHGKDGLVVTCEDERLELNRIYVIYSPNSFVKANDKQGESIGQGNLHRPRQLSLKDFTRWMNRLCSRDKNVGRTVIPIKIKKQQ